MPERSWPMNTHIHLPPNFSAFERVEDAVAQAVSEGLSVLGASNYYDFTVYRRFENAARLAGLVPLFGIEIMAMDGSLARSGVLVNDPGNPGKTYLCGKGIRQWSDPVPGARSVLDRIRMRDTQRMAELMARVNRHCADHDLPLDICTEYVIRDVSQRSGSPESEVVLQERHVARAFQEAFFRAVSPPDRARRFEPVLDASLDRPDDALAVQDAIRSRLMKSGRPGYVAEDYVTVEEAVTLVRALGGIPCYPVLADGASPITDFESDPHALVSVLRAWGIEAVEFIPRRNAPDVLERYVGVFEEAGFLLLAGTEHNTPERIPLVPACRGGAPLQDRSRAAFTRGARAIAQSQL